MTLRRGFRLLLRVCVSKWPEQNQSCTGIRIGLPDLDVSPMINPANLFEEVNRGRTFDSVVDELADMAGDALTTADTLKENSFT